RYRETILQPGTLTTGSFSFVTPPSGTPITLPSVALRPSIFPDSDHDGLPNDAEFVLGTNPNEFSTAGDGISDGLKLQQGLDSLSGLVFPTGIVASLSLKGEAKGVVAEGSTLNARGQIAYVAAGSGGLAIVDASQFQTPILLSQLALPGDASGVAV